MLIKKGVYTKILITISLCLERNAVFLYFHTHSTPDTKRGFSPHTHGPILQHLLGVPQFSSALTLSSWILLALPSAPTGEGLSPARLFSLPMPITSPGCHLYF